MKKIIIKLGEILATLLMFAPIYIIHNFKNISNPLFWLICSILYDFYLYNVISFNNYMDNKNELYKNVCSGKALNSDSEENKMHYYKNICNDIFNEFFKNK